MDKIKAIVYNGRYERKVVSGEPGSESVGYVLECARELPYTLRELLQYVASNVTEFGLVRVQYNGVWQTVGYNAGKITTWSAGDWSCLLKRVKVVTANGGFGAVDYNVMLDVD